MTLGALAALAGCASGPDPARLARGKGLYEVSCAACHQAHGRGMEGVGPPLAGSEWVLGSEERLVLIGLHGVRGTIDVNGVEYNLEMPAMGFFDDRDLSDILTYIRRAWGNEAAPVAAGTVGRIRRETANRRDSWAAEELTEID